MGEDFQSRCYVPNVNQTFNNITIYIVDGDTENYAFAVSLLINIFVFLSNTMLIYGLHKTNRQLSLTKKLFIYSSIVDITSNCIGLVGNVMVFYVHNISCIVNLVIASIINGLNCTSFELLFNISVLRYLSIVRPFLRIRTSHQKAVLIIELICALSTCILSVFFIQSLSMDSHSYSQYITTVIFLILIGVVLIINILSYKAMHKKKRKTPKTTNNIAMKLHESYRISPAANTSSNTSDKRTKAAVVTLIIITVSYVVCNLPIITFILIGTLQSYLNEPYLFTQTVNPILLVAIMHYIQLINGGVNAIIYILRSKEIRKFYKSKFIRVSD